MLSKFKVQRYKSLFDVDIDLEPLTVFIGPNGSGKSNICEALAVISDFLKRLASFDPILEVRAVPFFALSFQNLSKQKNLVNQAQLMESKFWHGKTDFFGFSCHIISDQDELSKSEDENIVEFQVLINYDQQVISLERFQNQSTSSNHTSSLRNHLDSIGYRSSKIYQSLKRVDVYDFSPVNLVDDISLNVQRLGMTGQGIAHTLANILLTNREKFDELEKRLRLLVPNIQRILTPLGEDQKFSLKLLDKYSEHHIPASDISDGTLRILAFLTALYQEETPSIICFEEPENGVHPWLLHKMMELLKLVSTEGIAGQPVQVLITTHSPVLLNYVDPHQVRAVELDHEGKTQVHTLPVESVRFQKAMEAYDGALGELWFTNVFGGNPA